MRPVVAVFISGFSIGFAVTVNPSVHHPQYHIAYLQGREYEYYYHREQLNQRPVNGYLSYQICFPSAFRSRGQDPGSALR